MTDVTQPNPASLCHDCFFFADGNCLRFQVVRDRHFKGKDEDVVITGCGGYESVNPLEESVADALA